MKRLDAPAGSVIIDLACGTGDFCREIEKHGMVAVGLDLSMGMLVAARTESPLVHADILAMPLADRSVDGATCGFALRNLIELEGFFDEVARVVRPGGRIAFLDASPPENPILRFGHGIYFNKIVPLIGGLLSEGRALRIPAEVGRVPSAVARAEGSDGGGRVRRRRAQGCSPAPTCSPPPGEAPDGRPRCAPRVAQRHRHRGGGGVLRAARLLDHRSSRPRVPRRVAAHRRERRTPPARVPTTGGEGPALLGARRRSRRRAGVAGHRRHRTPTGSVASTRCAARRS